MKFKANPFNLPIAQLAIKVPASESPVTMVGYGILRFASVLVTSVTDTIIYFTPEPKGFLTNPIGLCEGDSGGPLFMKEGGAEKVVGVETGYSPIPNMDNPSLNSFYRIDTDAAGGVAKWIASHL